jgi:hypothetical protein
MKKYTKQIIYASAAVIVAALLAGAYIYVQHDKDHLSQQAKVSPNQADLNACLGRVDQEYHQNFDSALANAGRTNAQGLPADVADHIEALYKDRKDTCFRQYPVN